MLALALALALAGSSPEPSTPAAPAPAPAGEPPVAAEPTAPPPAPAEPGTPPVAEPPVAEPPAPAPEPATPSEPPAPDPAPSEPDPALEVEPAVEAGRAGDPFELQPPVASEEPRRRRPPRSLYGRAWITGGLGASQRHVALGVGGVYFVSPWVGVGLDLDDTIVFATPGYNVFELTPKVVVLALPYRRVTPLVQVGMGGAFFNKGLGSYGRWVTGAGVAMAFGRFNLRAGVDVNGLVPDARYADRFQCGVTSSPCSLGISPWLGFGVGF